ncbi:helix-turn-helix transcriptional regulator [Streptomyces sp. NPDC098077]|uniref:helix-turn-helix transcriptional regulator n=1 Tax=Streptomyces sp. NPDC098077 TaxID=3366093 RepID=UPI00380644D5
MSSGCPLTRQQTKAVALLAAGQTVGEIGHELGVRRPAGLISEAKVKAGVTTDRALVYVSLARRWITPPVPDTAGERLSELEELVWAGLRFDVPDSQLPSVLAPVARTTNGQVKDILTDLKERHQLTYCGLITRGYALGVLSGREGTDLPQRAPATAAASRPPRPGPSRTGPWQLTGRQHEALTLLPACRTTADAAAEMGLTINSYGGHLKKISEIADVHCLRALTHRALQYGLLSPPSAPHPCLSDLTPELATVWRCLVMDVPDAELVAEISAKTGLDGSMVRSALARLRDQGEADWQLVVRGWERGIITAQDAVARPGRRSGRRPSSTRPTSASARRPAPRQAGPQGDRLLLLAGIEGTFTPGNAGRVGVPTGRDVVTGRDVDLVRVDLGSCRQLLAGTRATSWGPVIADVEGNIALLLTRPGALPARWRARYGRLWRRDAVVYLPPEYGPSPSGAYWAVSCRAPLWPEGFLQQALNTLPASAARPETPGGGR